jgi:hypothetical protein
MQWKLRGVKIAPKKGKKYGYRSMSIKEEFASNIEKFIDENPQLGYRSIASFLEEAARRRLETLKDKQQADTV